MTIKIIEANVGVIGDTHEPFVHRHYLDFCVETFKKWKCKTFVHIGDLVDNHASSYHEHDPDGMSHGDEIEQARKNLINGWYKAFPKVKLCRGNHDELVHRQARTRGMSKKVIKSFREMWSLPTGWEYDWDYEINGVLYEHGTRFGGKTPHILAMDGNRQSTVIGHSHSVSGLHFNASRKDRVFGVSVGCGIDRHRYAFEYGRNFVRKPVISCAVIIDQGRTATICPMEMGKPTQS